MTYKNLKYILPIITALAIAPAAIKLTVFKSIPGVFTAITSDQQGNVIAADEQGYITKWNSNGDQMVSVSFQNYGSSPYIDASNGLDVFVYYPGSRILLVLDNQMNQRRIVDFNRLQNYQIQGIGRAADGRCWILDSRDGFLRKIDLDGRVQQEIMLSGVWLPRGVTRIWDNGEQIILGGMQDTVLRVLTSTMNKITLLPKKPGFWTCRDNRIYQRLDSNKVLSTAFLRPGSNDTITTIGKHLERAHITSRGLVNLAADGLYLYR